MGYVVVAEFCVLAGQGEAFGGFMKRHAALSRAEPGCRMFEVARDEADPARFLLFEVYDDAAAYVAHRATQHYARFRTEASVMLMTKDGDLFVRRSVLQQI